LMLVDAKRLRPRDEWTLDDGVVLWWVIPLSPLDPPSVGLRALDDEMVDGHYTHWTPIIYPDQQTAVNQGD
jgi:hypothetical protein